MRRTLRIVVQRLRLLRDGAAQLIVLLRARGQLRIALAAVIAGCLAVGGAGACWISHASNSTPALQDTKDAWRYLLVCGKCKYRQKSIEHPIRRLPKRGGLLKCPRCGRFEATWHRRGSQAVPPGGW